MLEACVREKANQTSRNALPFLGQVHFLDCKETEQSFLCRFLEHGQRDAPARNENADETSQSKSLLITLDASPLASLGAYRAYRAFSASFFLLRSRRYTGAVFHFLGSLQLSFVSL
jgi:hypothetical protein